MTCYDNVGGTLRETSKIYDNVGGTLREVDKGYDNVGGTLRIYHESALYLFLNGNEYTATTGGWYKYGASGLSGNNLYLKNAIISYKHPSLETTNAIDFTPWSKLHITCTQNYNTSRVSIGSQPIETNWWSEAQGHTMYARIMNTVQTSAALNTQEINIDVSGIKGSYYIGFYKTLSQLTVPDVLINNIYLY